MADILAEAMVMVGADVKQFDKAMDLLKPKAKAAIEETVKIIEDKIAAVKAEIPLRVGDPVAVQQLTDYLDQLKEQLDRVKISAVQQAQGLNQVTQATNRATQATQQARGGFQNLGYAALMVSQAVEDVQYGFSAIVNNIPGIAMAAGATAGWAAAASLVSVAINILINNWSKLADAFGMGKVKTQAEEMEELRKKTALTADEAERLQRADALQNKTKEIQQGKTDEQKKTEDAVTHAITEAGGRNVAAGILRFNPQAVDNEGDAAIAKEELEKTRKKVQEYKESQQKLAGLSFEYSEQYGRMADEEAAKIPDLEQKLHAARQKTAMDLADKGSLSKLFPRGLPDLRKFVDEGLAKDPNAFGDQGAKLSKDLREATPEFRQREKSRQQRIKAQQDRRERADREGQMDTSKENFAATGSADRLDRARKDLAEAIENDPYSTGKIAAAEESYRKAIEDQEKLLEETYKKRKGRIDEMADQGLISDEEKAARMREIDTERMRNQSSTRGSKESLDDIRRQQAVRMGAGFQDRYRIQALRDIGLGRQVDQGALRNRVSSDLQKQGTAKADADSIAKFIVKDLVDKVQGQVNQEAQSRGITTQEGGKNLAAKQADEDASKAYHEGGFSDLSGFYSKLQSAASNSDQYAQMTAQNTRDAADASWEVVQELRNQALNPAPKAPPAVAQGPAN